MASLITVATDVLDAIEAIGDKGDSPRRYIGASIIGSECEALIALNMRGFPSEPVDSRLQRIFDLGHVIEDVIVDLLKRAGISLAPLNPATGKQWEFNLFGKVISCHLDGLAKIGDKELVFEAKSMNEDNFDAFKSFGVRVSHPKYYLQTMLCMGLSGRLRTLFVAYCKNNSAVHAEYIDFDPAEFAYLIYVAKLAMQGQSHRVARSETDWRCKGCFKRGACWKGRFDTPNCAKCAASTVDEDGKWKCSVHKKSVDIDPDGCCDKFEVYRPLEKK